jgi:hypothetical protein
MPADFCYGIFLKWFLADLEVFEAGVGICALSRCTFQSDKIVSNVLSNYLFATLLTIYLFFIIEGATEEDRLATGDPG